MDADTVLADYEAAHADFSAGKIQALHTATLRRHLAALCNQRSTNDSTHHRDVIRALTINHELMQRHLDAMQRRADRMQCLFLILTVAGVVAALAQVWAAFRPS